MRLEKTNWDLYYKKSGKVIKTTRNITQNILLLLFKKYTVKPEKICEMGGANSCFYRGIRNVYPDANYIVIDNNDTGLNLFMKNNSNDKNISLVNKDLLTNNAPIINADIVFSIGLIEHFSKTDTAKIIREHFRAVNNNAIVIISFPTPTFLYRIVRVFAELAGIWRFPDERPLLMDKVSTEVSKYGEILESFINWKIILTQGIIAIRPNVTGSEVDTIKLGEI